MKTSFELSIQLPATATEVYDAWLDSEKHTQMTGGFAECSTEIGATFSAWDGYITGCNLHLKPNTEIEQSWRTTQFEDSDADSHLKIQLKDNKEGMLLTLIHSKIPEGQPDYAQGWQEHYFEPMLRYFEAADS